MQKGRQIITDLAAFCCCIRVVVGNKLRESLMILGNILNGGKAMEVFYQHEMTLSERPFSRYLRYFCIFVYVLLGIQIYRVDK